MADQLRLSPDSDESDREEIRDETDEDDEEFDEGDDLDDEEDEEDMGKHVRDQERGTMARRAFTGEIGSEGGSAGHTEVGREHGRRVNAGEATTTGGQPIDETRIDDRQDE